MRGSAAMSLSDRDHRRLHRRTDGLDVADDDEELGAACADADLLREDSGLEAQEGAADLVPRHLDQTVVDVLLEELGDAAAVVAGGDPLADAGEQEVLDVVLQLLRVGARRDTPRARIDPERKRDAAELGDRLCHRQSTFRSVCFALLTDHLLSGDPSVFPLAESTRTGLPSTFRTLD